MEKSEAGRTWKILTFKIISGILMDIYPNIEVTGITDSIALKRIQFYF